MTTLPAHEPVLFCATGHVEIRLKQLEPVAGVLGTVHECPICKLKTVVSPKSFQLLFCFKHGRPVPMQPEGEIGTNADTYRCPVCDNGLTVYPHGDFESCAPRPEKLKSS